MKTTHTVFTFYQLETDTRQLQSTPQSFHFTFAHTIQNNNNNNNYNNNKKYKMNT